MSAELEFFADVPGYEGVYQVSDRGRVLSLERRVKNGDSIQSVRERIIKPILESNGYLYVHLSKDGKVKMFLVSRLVALTFLEREKDKPTVDHINRNRTDNRLENLRWASSTEQSRNTSSFKEYISISFYKSSKYPSKWRVQFRYENEKVKNKFFLTELEARAFAQTLDKTRIVPLISSSRQIF
jgi:hypothetical protein